MTDFEMKIITVVGARPNFMKVAPIINAIRKHNDAHAQPQIKHILVHTGQHYDSAMSDQFFSDLDLPAPDSHLGVGSGSHAAQTAEIMKKFEPILLSEKPDFVIVVGDVNSTLACSLVTAKISFDPNGTRPSIVHVESGLRSFDRAMPEEINRIATDHVADLLFITEESGFRNLQREGISSDKIHFVGNTMIDSLRASEQKSNSSSILEELGLRRKTNGDPNSTRPYALLTLHRPSNVDDVAAFRSIMQGLGELAESLPIVFPVHPRTRNRVEELGAADGIKPPATNEDGPREPDAKPGPYGFLFTGPRGYLDFLCLMKHAKIVVTDSGGIQEETTCLGVPCVTLRKNTERPVTIDHGTNVLGGTEAGTIRDAIRSQLNRAWTGQVPKYWDGSAAQRILSVLIESYCKKRAPDLLVHSE